MQSLKASARALVRRAGWDVVRYDPRSSGYPLDFDPATIATIEATRAYTMTSAPRIYALCSAVRYVARHGIPGAVVECGVWRGGSMLAVARTLLELGVTDRELYLFDTFEGMVAPTGLDRRHDGVAAAELLEDADPSTRDRYLCRASIDDVSATMATVAYPHDRVHLVPGKVEDTVPQHAPEQIALLRLDTDWYESTKHELEHLFPRLAPFGVLIVDDYGYWEGARRAVDEFLAALDVPVLLNRIDHTGRIAVVPAAGESEGK